MAETSGFFNSQLVDGQPDIAYEATDFANYYGMLISNGVFASPASNLQVVSESSATNIKVKKGSAFIKGYWYILSDDLSLALQANTGNSTRYDSIILTLDIPSRQISLSSVTGKSSSSGVPAPVLTRDDSIYQLCLAQVAVLPQKSGMVITDGRIYDKRPDAKYCGFVTGLVDQIDTTNLFAQYNSEFTEWFTENQKKLGDTPAAKLQVQIDSLTKEFCEVSCDGFTDVFLFASSVPNPTKCWSLTASTQKVSNQRNFITKLNDVDELIINFKQPGFYKFNSKLLNKVVFTGISDDGDGHYPVFDISLVIQEKSIKSIMSSSDGIIPNQRGNVYQFEILPESVQPKYYTTDNPFASICPIFTDSQIVEITESDLNKDFKICLTVSGTRTQYSATMDLASIGSIDLLIEYEAYSPAIPQQLLDFVRISQDEYAKLSESEKLSQYTLYFVYDDKNNINMMYMGNPLAGGSGSIPAIASAIAEGITGTTGLAELSYNTEFNLMEESWEQGSIYDNGNNFNSSTRIRTPDYIDLSNATDIFYSGFTVVAEADKNIQYTFNFYDSEKKILTTSTNKDWLDNGKPTMCGTASVPSYVRVVLRHADDSNITPDMLTSAQLRILA